MICPRANCCKDKNGKGEGTIHTSNYHGELGMLYLFDSNSVYLLVGLFYCNYFYIDNFAI